MADLTAQTEDTAPSYTDIFYGVKDPGGSPLDRKLAYQAMLNLLEENPQTGTTYTLALTDRAKLVSMNNAAANVVTVPTNAAVAFPIGSSIIIEQLGAGVTTITGDTGVTIRGGGASVSAGSGAISNRYDIVTLIKRATNTWVAQGSIGAIA